MALPLPPAPGTSFLEGLETMQQRLQQSRLAMQQRELEKQRMVQQAQQFQQQMGMRQKLMPYQIQALQDAHKQAEYARNPALQLQDMMQTLGRQDGPEQMGDGTQQPKSLDIKELAKNNPMIRGWYKKQFGIDPLSVDPNLKPMSTLGKAMYDYSQAKTSGTASEEDLKNMEAYIKRLSEGTPGMQLEFDPDTKALKFSTGRGQGAASQEVLPDGTVVQKPTTATMTRQQRISVANTIREAAFKDVEMPYLGASAELNLINDLALVNNPQIQGEQRQKIEENLVRAAVTARLLPEVAAAQLTAQGNVNPAMTIQLEQQKLLSQGWPHQKVLQRVLNNLPQNLEQRAKQMHDEKVGQISNLANQFAARGFPVKIENNPDASQKSEEKITIRNKKTGITETVTVEEARRRGVPNV